MSTTLVCPKMRPPRRVHVFSILKWNCASKAACNARERWVTIYDTSKNYILCDRRAIVKNFRAKLILCAAGNWTRASVGHFAIVMADAHTIYLLHWTCLGQKCVLDSSARVEASFPTFNLDNVQWFILVLCVESILWYICFVTAYLVFNKKIIILPVNNRCEHTQWYIHNYRIITNCLAAALNALRDEVLYTQLKNRSNRRFNYLHKHLRDITQTMYATQVHAPFALACET